MYKRILSFLPVLCLMLGLTPALTLAQPETPNTAQVNTITDMAGTIVTLPPEINRIISLWHANNQVILMLGAADKLIGTTYLN